MNCIWKIVAPQGQVVRLEILSLRMGTDCCLEVQDGIGEENTFEFSKCGTRPSPFVVYSTGRDLSLKANTVDIDCTPGPGFIANYSFVPEGKKCSIPTTLTRDIQSDFRMNLKKCSQFVSRTNVWQD